MPPTLTLTPPRVGWMDAAACRGYGDVMDAETEADEGVAKEICHACPVRAQCGRWVISLPYTADVYGVAAGMTAVERQHVRWEIRRRRDPDEPLRTCRTCGEEKPAEEFGLIVAEGRRDTQCRTCVAEKAAVYKARKREARAAARREAVAS